MPIEIYRNPTPSTISDHARKQGYTDETARAYLIADGSTRDVQEISRKLLGLVLNDLYQRLPEELKGLAYTTATDGGEQRIIVETTNLDPEYLAKLEKVVRSMAEIMEEAWNKHQQTEGHAEISDRTRRR